MLTLENVSVALTFEPVTLKPDQSLPDFMKYLCKCCLLVQIPSVVHELSENVISVMRT